MSNRGNHAKSSRSTGGQPVGSWGLNAMGEIADFTGCDYCQNFVLGGRADEMVVGLDSCRIVAL